MAKAPKCDTCGKLTGVAGHWTLVCVERIARSALTTPEPGSSLTNEQMSSLTRLNSTVTGPEVPSQGTVTPPKVPLQITDGTVISTVTCPPSTVTNDDGTVTMTAARTVREIRVPKNRAWEQRNPDKYRTWRREYMRRRRVSG